MNTEVIILIVAAAGRIVIYFLEGTYEQNGSCLLLVGRTLKHAVWVRSYGAEFERSGGESAGTDPAAGVQIDGLLPQQQTSGSFDHSGALRPAAGPTRQTQRTPKHGSLATAGRTSGKDARIAVNELVRRFSPG